MKTQIPDDCPTEDDKTLAVAYWTKKGRTDLIEDIEDQCDMFRAHHEAHGKTMKNWSAAFKTWYMNAVRFTKKRQTAPTEIDKIMGGDW